MTSPTSPSFSAAASLGPVVLSQSGQDSIYLHVKKTFLEFYTQEQKDAKRSACIRSLSSDCANARCKEAGAAASTPSSVSGEPQATDNTDAAMNTSSTQSRCQSRSLSSQPQVSDDSCSVCTASFKSPTPPQQVSPRTWDVAEVAKIPSFVPQPRVFMWPMACNQQAPDSPTAISNNGVNSPVTKKQLQKKDLSKLGSTDVAEVTTVMVRGIPCSFSQDRVLQILNDVGLEGKYNFFYLPYAGKSSSNLGYAFVNFVDAESAAHATASLDGVALDPERSVKFCTITPADIQGLENLRKHFRRTAVCRSRRGPMFLQTQMEAIEVAA